MSKLINAMDVAHTAQARNWAERAIYTSADNAIKSFETFRDIEEAISEKIIGDIAVLLGFPCVPTLFKKAVPGIDTVKGSFTKTDTPDIYIEGASLACAQDFQTFEEFVLTEKPTLQHIHAVFRAIAPQFSAYAALYELFGGAPDVAACNVILHADKSAAYFIDYGHDKIPKNRVKDRFDDYGSMTYWFVDSVYDQHVNAFGRDHPSGERRLLDVERLVFCSATFEHAIDKIKKLPNEQIVTIVTRAFEAARTLAADAGLDGKHASTERERAYIQALLRRRDRIDVINTLIINPRVHTKPRKNLARRFKDWKAERALG